MGSQEGEIGVRRPEIGVPGVDLGVRTHPRHCLGPAPAPLGPPLVLLEQLRSRRVPPGHTACPPTPLYRDLGQGGPPGYTPDPG